MSSGIVEQHHSVARRARQALARSLRATGVSCDERGYVERAEYNVLCQDGWSSIQGDMAAGAGGELSTSTDGELPKLCAVHSSAALAVNAFGKWRNDPAEFRIAGISGFTELRFEHRCGAGVRGTAPHLDVLARTPDVVVAIESKCTEYLRPKSAHFAEAYSKIEDGRKRSPWFSIVSDAAVRQRFALLDAGQLVKHYLGLANTFRQGPVLLLYLFWEPLNAGDFRVFADHRRELREFAEAVAGDRVEFKYQSYPELWREWDALGGAARQHVADLRKRYLVSL